MNPVYIPDIIGSAVTSVQADILSMLQQNEAAITGKPSQIRMIDYQYGHKMELLETLYQKDKSSSGRFEKYPLVYLVQDFSEQRGDKIGLYAETSLNIIIAHQTKSDYKIWQRYPNVFKPVLYPIYYSLLETLAVHPLVNNGSVEMMAHTKTDRSFWGRNAIGGNDKTMLNDYVDAIEISNLKLLINYETCPDLVLSTS